MSGSSSNALSDTQTKQLMFAMQTLGIEDIHISYEGSGDSLNDVSVDFTPDVESRNLPFEFETVNFNFDHQSKRWTAKAEPKMMRLESFIQDVFFNAAIQNDGLEGFWNNEGASGVIELKTQEDGTLLYKNTHTFSTPTEETYTNTLSIADSNPWKERPRAF